MKILPLLLVALFGHILAGFAAAQSPNLQSAVTRSDLTALQRKDEKGVAGGYAALTSGTVVAPQFLFPNFAAANAGALLIKSGSSVSFASPFSAQNSLFVVNQVGIGEISGTSGLGSIYGIKTQEAALPLTLAGGDNSGGGEHGRVYVAYGQDLGGAATSSDSNSTFSWRINSDGTFELGTGTFMGTLMGSGSSTLSLGSSPAITVPSGIFTISANGLAVPSTASGTNNTFALNVQSANSLYGQLALSNSWSGVQTFPAIAVPDGSIAVSKIAGLSGAVATLLPLDGHLAMTGTLSMGNNRIVGLADPVGAQDAVTKAYLGITPPSLVVSSGSPLGVTFSSGTATLALPAASSGTSGYLTSADWVRFNAASAGSVTAVSSPFFAASGLSVVTTSGTAALSLAMASGTSSGYLGYADWLIFDQASRMPASASNNGYLGYSDWIAFNTVARTAASGTSSGYLASRDWIAFNAVARTAASGTSSGYLTSSNFSIFNSAVASISGSGPLVTSRIGNDVTVGLPLANSDTSGYLSHTDWTTFSNCVRDISTIGPIMASRAGNSISLGIRAVTSSTDGYLTAADYSTLMTSLGTAASGTSNGYLKTADWIKFNAAYTTSTAAIGSISLTYPFSDAITISGNSATISLPAAASGTSGYMTAADWGRLDAVASMSVDTQGGIAVANMNPPSYVYLHSSYLHKFYTDHSVGLYLCMDASSPRRNSTLYLANTSGTTQTVTLHATRIRLSGTCGNDVAVPVPSATVKVIQFTWDSGSRFYSTGEISSPLVDTLSDY